MDTPDHDPIEADRIQAFFDAISSGNLRRVKALLAEEPQLLFADLDDRASPLSVWYGFWAEFRHFLKVMEARRPLERESNDASAKQDWDLAFRLSERTARAWESHVDWDFIAALERWDEP